MQFLFVLVQLAVLAAYLGAFTSAAWPMPRPEIVSQGGEVEVT